MTVVTFTRESRKDFINKLIGLSGQRVTQRPPIGKTDIISNAPVDLVRDYYRTNYRPERATLVVVGDIDAAAIEADIRNRFGNWTSNTPAPAAIDLGSLEKRGERVGTVIVPGGATRVQMAWTRPYDASQDTVAKRRQQLVEGIGLAVLNRRISVLAQQPNAPFVSAQAGSQNLLKSARATIIAADTDPDRWQAALAAIDQEQRRIAEFGVAQSEIDRELAEYRSMLQGYWRNDAATRQTLVDGWLLTGDIGFLDHAGGFRTGCTRHLRWSSARNCGHAGQFRWP